MEVSLLNFKSWLLILGLFFSSFGVNLAAAQSLELVCENVRAAQTNFQKNFFDSYGAATDSQNSRFSLYSNGEVFHHYPADSTTDEDNPDYQLLKDSFHNLSGRQVFLEGFGVTEKYIKSITFHRNQSDQWVLQITNSGNNEDSLFHRMYFYECVSMKDNIN